MRVSTGHVSTADGSAVVKSGNTTIVCGVRAEITTPHPDYPQLGFIVPNFSFASGSATSSGPSHETQRVTQYLLDVLDSSGCVNRHELCIEDGERVWVLYVDLVCLDHNGNIFDSSVTAMVAALQDTKLPSVTFDRETNEISCSSSKGKSLNLENKPCSNSYAIFSNSTDPKCPHVVMDPTDEEEELSNSVLSIVTIGENTICHMVCPGGDLLTPSILQTALGLAFRGQKLG